MTIWRRRPQTIQPSKSETAVNKYFFAVHSMVLFFRILTDLFCFSARKITVWRMLEFADGKAGRHKKGFCLCCDRVKY
jgi:hypothetical protein